MTTPSRDDTVNAWYGSLTDRLDALRDQWAAEAAEQAARPRPPRRTAASPHRRRVAGPPDAARQALQAEAARQLAQARQDWLISMEQAALDIALIGP